MGHLYYTPSSKAEELLWKRSSEYCKLEEVDDYKEMVYSRHSRTVAHINSQNL